MRSTFEFVQQRTLLSYFAFLIFFLLGQEGIQASCTFDKGISSMEFEIGIMLSWSTSSEENNSMFVVETSEDGTSFSDIGTVKGSGTTMKMSEYTFLDPNTRAQKIYYRLKQLDFDGSFTYSEVVTIEKKKPNQFTVAQMSAIATLGPFSLTMDSYIDAELRYIIKNWKGEPVMEDVLIMGTGLNDFAFDLSSYSEGIYKLVLSAEGETETLTLMKVAADKKPNLATTKKIKKD